MSPWGKGSKAALAQAQKDQAVVPSRSPEEEGRGPGDPEDL